MNPCTEHNPIQPYVKADPLLTRYDALVVRLNALLHGIKHSLRDAHDDPNNHLRPCVCGRGWTRQGHCALCATEEYRRNAGEGMRVKRV